LASVTLNGITGHVPGIIPVTFAGLSVTFPESPVTLDRNTQQIAKLGATSLWTPQTLKADALLVQGQIACK